MEQEAHKVKSAWDPWEWDCVHILLCAQPQVRNDVIPIQGLLCTCDLNLGSMIFLQLYIPKATPSVGSLSSLAVMSKESPEQED